MSDRSLELMPAVILAGGQGNRLSPLTDRLPKALVDVAGQPFLLHQLELLQRNGVRRVVLAVGYLGERIQERFGDGSEIGIELQYSFDGPVLLGTAGAIRQALHLLPDKFFVLYGDSYLMCDYRAVEEAFRRSGLSGLITVFRNDDLFDRSNVQFENGRILRYDKRNRTPAMRYIEYGLGAFDRSVFGEISAGQNPDLEDIYQKLLQNSNLAAFEVHERFYEIGSPEGLRDAIQFFLSKRLR